MTRTYLYEAANAHDDAQASADRGCATGRSRSPNRTGPRKAKVALARKLAVILHAMWRTGKPFKERLRRMTRTNISDRCS